MPLFTLIADPEAIHLLYLRPSLSAITLVVHTTARRAHCPRCHQASLRVHSRYTRAVADLPWHGWQLNSNCTHGASAAEIVSARSASAHLLRAAAACRS